MVTEGNRESALEVLQRGVKKKSDTMGKYAEAMAEPEDEMAAMQASSIYGRSILG